jgi:hypothetical protein
LNDDVEEGGDIVTRYNGGNIEVEYFATKITDPVVFFGGGAEDIFDNPRKRPVEKVIREIERHIAHLKEPEYDHEESLAAG